MEANGTVENLVGNKWNSFNMVGSKWNSFNMVGFTTISLSFTIDGYYDANNTAEEPVTILDVEDQRMSSRRKPQIPVSISMSRFRKYRWEITKVGSDSMSLASIHMAYCKPVGAICAGEGAYPSVNEGQMSVKNCGYGYRDRKSTRLNSSHRSLSRMPSSA